MSSPFQKNFSAKSPLNGNYYSGVDGIKYVSPKPGVINIPQGTKKKEEEEEVKTPKVKQTREKGEPVVDLKPSGIETSKVLPVAEINPKKVVLKNRKDFTNKQTLEKEIKGKPVEKFAKKGTPEYDRWLAAVKRDPSIEDKYKDRTLYQDQEQKGFTIDGETTLGDWMNVGEKYEK